jgi:hypothetical protein
MVARMLKLSPPKPSFQGRIVLLEESDMKGNYSGSAESNFWALQRAVR